MKSLRAWFCRPFAIFRKPQPDAELTEESESRLQLPIDENLCAGTRPKPPSATRLR